MHCSYWLETVLFLMAEKCFVICFAFARFLLILKKFPIDNINPKITSSCYTLYWDLIMDWGVLASNAGENR